MHVFSLYFLSFQQEDDAFERELDQLQRSQDKEKRSFSCVQTTIDEMKKLGRLKGADVWDVIPRYPSGSQQFSYFLGALLVTQVSVERLFSAMKLIITDLRSRLKPDVVEAMLLIRSNLL